MGRLEVKCFCLRMSAIRSAGGAQFLSGLMPRPLVKGCQRLDNSFFACMLIGLPLELFHWLSSADYHTLSLEPCEVSGNHLNHQKGNTP